jgi:hypothetical protein
MSKFVIIGGGISSCVIAFFLLKKNHTVEIYEKKNDLGGILNDFQNDKDIFFRGCQYLDVNNDWFETFKNEISEDLNIFEHTYGSYVEINGTKSFSDRFAVPFFKNLDLKNYDISNISKKPLLNMMDRFNLYPKKISNFFKDIIVRHNLDPTKLNYDSAGSLQMSRITSQEEENELIELKKKNKILEDIFAVHRKHIFKNEKKLLGALPKNGFTNLFKKLKKKLEQKGVKIYLNSRVIPKWKDNNLKIFLGENIIKNDKVIWTGDPTKLIKQSIDKDIDSKYVNILQTNSNISKSNNFKDKYIQIFSDNKILTKIYLYKINQVEKISVESMFVKTPPTKILNEATEILKDFGINIELDKKSYFQKLDLRFNLVSLDDENTIQAFLKKTKDTNLLPGAWLIYGRDRKLHFYLQRLKEENFI